MKTKLTLLIIALVTVTTVIIAQQYERVLKIYKGENIVNSYVLSEVDSIKFEKVALFSVEVQATPEEGGSATLNGGEISLLLKENDDVALVATAESGYQFMGWSVNGTVVSTENPYLTKAEASCIYVATFTAADLEYCAPTSYMSSSRRLDSFTITDGENSVNVSSVQYSTYDAVYKDKTESVLSTTPGATLRFSALNWLGEWMHGYTYIDYSRDGEFDQATNADGTTGGELVSFSHYNGVNSLGSNTSNGAGVSTTLMPSWTLPDNLTPGEYRLRFKIDWNDIDPCGSIAPGNLIQNNGGCICDITLSIASIAPIYSTTVISTPSNAGVAAVVAENYDKVTLSATAKDGYVFDCWKVGGIQVSEENPYTATLTADTEFEAIFREAQNVTISALATEGGTVEVSETNPLEGTEITLTATPDEGYKFENWTLSDEVVSTDNPYIVVVNGAATYTANFAVITPSLPKVYVETPNGVEITSKEIWTEDCVIRMEDEDGVEVLNGGTSFRGRGNSTWGYPKKPYAIKLDSKAEVLGMPKHKRWVLLANWMDRTLLRNAVSFEIARNCMDWAPRGKFVEFYLNGVHQGNYYLCEQIKFDKNRVNGTEFEDGEGTGEEGAFLLEFDTNYQAEINYFYSQSYYYPVTIKEPDEEIITSWSHPYFTYIADYIADVESALVSEDFETVFSQIDCKTYVDFLLIYELTTNSEPNHPKSCYMYKDAGGKLKAGPVWDFDWGTFNPNKSGFLNTTSLWYTKLMKSAEFQSMLKARWAELKQKIEYIGTFIDEQADLIRESEAVNHEMWPIDSRNNYPNGDERMTFDEAVARMKQTLESRISALDALIGTPENVTISVTAAEGGTAEVSTTNPYEGSEITLTATPDEGYEFVNWTLNGVEVSTSNPYTVVASADAAYTANFEPEALPLPKVYVETPNGVAITSKDIWTEDCVIRMEDETGAEVLNSGTSFRGRGNSTWNYPKKPYAIKLDSKAEVLGMPKHKRWVLLANWMDRTLLRNAVSFELARNCSVWAPRGKFVEFYLNGEHQGNYYLCEQIKFDKNRINGTEFEDGEGTGEEGAFLLEFDTNYQAEINYFYSQSYYYPVTIKEPDEEIITSWTHPYFSYISDYVADVESALVSEDFETVFSKIDYNTYIDYLLIYELTTNEEPNHPKSCYMYKDAGGKLIAGPVWDFDWGTFNPNKSGFLNTSALWYGKLMKSAEFKSALKARWAELKPKFETIDTFIDEQADLIRESEAVNHEMWPIDSRHNYPNGDELMTFDNAVARMKQAIDNRIQALDTAINAL